MLREKKSGADCKFSTEASWILMITNGMQKKYFKINLK